MHKLTKIHRRLKVATIRSAVWAANHFRDALNVIFEIEPIDSRAAKIAITALSEVPEYEDGRLSTTQLDALYDERERLRDKYHSEPEERDDYDFYR